MNPFERMASELDELAQAPQRVAHRAAPDVLEGVKATFEHGRLRGLIANTTARADGAAIVLEIDDRIPPEALHAEAFEERWTAPIAEALAEEGLA